MTLKWIHDGKLRWCWLQLGGAALMLQEFWTDGPQANVPKGKLGEGVSVCFICRDALAIYREVKPSVPPSIGSVKIISAPYASSNRFRSTVTFDGTHSFTGNPMLAPSMA